MGGALVLTALGRRLEMLGRLIDHRVDVRPIVGYKVTRSSMMKRLVHKG